MCIPIVSNYIVQIVSSLTPVSTENNVDFQPQNVQAVPFSQKAKEGRGFFLESNCGTCHHLNDADAEGQVGPNFNQLKPSPQQVQDAVKHGVGIMPAYGDAFSPEQLEALSQYIFEAAKK